MIKGGNVIDPANNISEKLDILTDGKVIAAVGKDISAPDAEVINAEGLTVVPGLVDIHVHFRDPGYEYKEDIITGSRAAARGGVTSVACMPNTKPALDCAALIQYVKNKAEKAGIINVFPVGCISKGLKGEELAEIGELKAAGAVGVSDDGRPVISSTLMRRALEYANMFNIPVMSHSEDLGLVDGGSMNEGYMSTYLGLRGIPKAAESVAVTRDILIAEEVGARIHICHVSTANSIDAVRQAKKRGVRVTCETAPHYFSLTDAACDGFNTNAKMNPPLRSAEDVEAVIAGLADGTIDAIATDHAPHHIDEKNVEFDKALNGIIGLETSLSLGITKLVNTGKLTLCELIKKMTYNPAKIIGTDRGTLSVGAPADITIFDAAEKYVVDVSKFASKSKNSPYGGMKLCGVVKKTIANGKIVYDGGIEI